MDVGCGNPVCHKRFSSTDSPITCKICKTISYCNEACCTANLELHRKHCTPRTHEEVARINHVKERLNAWMDANGAYYRMMLCITEMIRGQDRVLRVPMDHLLGKRMVILASKVSHMTSVVRGAYTATDTSVQFLTVFETHDPMETYWTRLYAQPPAASDTPGTLGTLGTLADRVHRSSFNAHVMFILTPSADNQTIQSIDFLPCSATIEPNLIFLSELFHHHSLPEIATMFGIH